MLSLDEIARRVRLAIGTEKPDQEQLSQLERILAGIKPASPVNSGRVAEHKSTGGEITPEPLPIVRLESPVSLRTDKSLMVTPYTTAKTEGIKAIIDNVNALILADSAHKFATINAIDQALNNTLIVRVAGGIAPGSAVDVNIVSGGSTPPNPIYQQIAFTLDTTSGSVVADALHDFGTCTTVELWGLYLSAYNGGGDFRLETDSGNTIIPWTNYNSGEKFQIGTPGAPLYTLDQISRKQIIFLTNTFLGDNSICLIFKVIP